MINYFVSNNGTGDGFTVANPTSLVGARDLVRANKHLGNITVFVRGGDYDVTATNGFTLGPEDKGVNGFVVIWRAYPGDPMPFLSGGQVVTGWIPHTDGTKNIWKATVPSGTLFRQLYVNGVKAPKSRYYGAIDFSVDLDIPELVMHTPLPHISQITALELTWTRAPYQWMYFMGRVTGISGVAPYVDCVVDINPVAAAAFRFWGNFNRNAINPKIENAYEFLNETTPGHWYHSTTANTIYYVPNPDDVVEGVFVSEVIIPKTETPLTFADGLENLYWVGIGVKYSNWTRPSTDGYLVTSSICDFMQSSAMLGDYSQPAAGPDRPENYSASSGIHIGVVENVHVLQTVSMLTGGQGLKMDDLAEKVSVVGSLITNTAYNGASLGDVQRFPMVVHRADTSKKIKFDQNWITKCGTEAPAGVGIQLGRIIDSSYSGNELDNLPYCGFLAMDFKGSASRCYGYRNKIHNVTQVNKDGGALYFNDRFFNSVLRFNHVESQSYYAPLYGDDHINGLTWTHNVVTKSTDGVYGVLLKNQNDQSGFEARFIDNYVEEGIYSEIYFPTNGFAEAPKTFPENQSLWPEAVVDVVENSGRHLLSLGEIIAGELLIFGWKSAEETLTFTVSDGLVSEYEEPFSQMWRASVKGITEPTISIQVNSSAGRFMEKSAGVVVLPSPILQVSNGKAVLGPLEFQHTPIAIYYRVGAYVPPVILPSSPLYAGLTAGNNCVILDAGYVEGADSYNAYYTVDGSTPTINNGVKITGVNRLDNITGLTNGVQIKLVFTAMFGLVESTPTTVFVATPASSIVPTTKIETFESLTDRNLGTKPVNGASGFVWSAASFNSDPNVLTGCRIRGDMLGQERGQCLQMRVELWEGWKGATAHMKVTGTIPNGRMFFEISQFFGDPDAVLHVQRSGVEIGTITEIVGDWETYFVDYVGGTDLTFTFDLQTPQNLARLQISKIELIEEGEYPLLSAPIKDANNSRYYDPYRSIRPEWNQYLTPFDVNEGDVVEVFATDVYASEWGFSTSPIAQYEVVYPAPPYLIFNSDLTAATLLNADGTLTELYDSTGTRVY